MSELAIQEVRSVVSAAVRHLPEAHAFEQFQYYEAKFRDIMTTFVGSVFAVTDVDSATDEQLQPLEEVVRAGINLLQMRLLLSGSSDTLDIAFYSGLTSRLKVALEGIEQGLHPDPSKRPSEDEMLSRLSARLREAGVA